MIDTDVPLKASAGATSSFSAIVNAPLNLAEGRTLVEKIIETCLVNIYREVIPSCLEKTIIQQECVRSCRSKECRNLHVQCRR